jgi:hypothetical protein
MKNRFNSALVVMALLSLWTLSGCGEDPKESPFTLTITGKVGTADFALDAPYNFDNGHQVKFSLFHFYMNQPRLVNAAGEEFPLSSVELVNFNTSNSYTITKNVPVDDYVAIRFGIGLDSVTNMSDPNTYPSNHPLSILAGTYWDWNTMYRFAMMEGTFDTTGTGNNYDLTFTYHPGLDEQYREMDMNATITVVEGQAGSYELILDVQDILRHPTDPIDMITLRTTHCATPSQIALAARIMDNFTRALTGQ